MSTVSADDTAMDEKAHHKVQEGLVAEKCYRQVIKDTRQYYCQTATIHGVSRTQEPQASFCKRLIWSALVTVMTVMLAITLYGQIKHFYERPIKTLASIEMNEELPFPAVTICNLNQYERDRVPDDPMVKNVLFTKSEYFAARKAQGHLSSLDNLTDVSGEELLRVTHHAAPRLEEFFLVCSWKQKTEDCKDIFHAINTTYGKCHRFNGDKDNIFKSKMSGSRESLSVRLDIRNNKSYFSQNVEAGVIVTVHSQEHPPIIQRDGYRIRPGVSAYIALTRKETSRLPYPYKAFTSTYCVDTASKDYVNKLTKYPEYSIGACEVECLANYNHETCGCRGFNDPGNTTICSAVQYIECLTPAVSAFRQADLMACACTEECDVVSYDAEITYADTASQFIQEMVIEDNLPYSDPQSAVKITIFYKTLNSHKLEQQPALSMVDILGKLGGQMGLFIGASLLSFAEILEMAYLTIYRLLKVFYRKRMPGTDKNSHKIKSRPELTHAVAFPKTRMNKVRLFRVDVKEGKHFQRILT